MIRRLFALLFLSVIVIGGSASFRPTHSASPEPCAAQDHETWLTQVLEKMETIKPGMTRSDLLKVFRTDGRGREFISAGPGLSTVLRSTFVSQDCPSCKVVVEFKAKERPVGFVTSVEDSQDIIVTISKPYLQSTMGLASAN